MQHLGSRFTAILLSLTFLTATLAPVQADYVSTQTAIEAEQLSYQKSDLIQALQVEEVQDRLVALGVDPSQVEDRVAAMTADEISQISAHIDDMAAGGDALGLVLTLFIVFVITDAICATDIFPFVNCIN